MACVLDFSGASRPQYLALDPASGAPPLELDRPPLRCDHEAQRSRIPAGLRETAGGIYSLSPDGRYLAFAAGQHPDTWVYVLDWERGTVRRLVRGTSPQFRPRPSRQSPAGRQR
ncbi:MAG: hypothetical protein K6T75_11620 [Acetobacteraceae bacterium]|nr:hypothetical protein [Acetobacteraceae bacterium]